MKEKSNIIKFPPNRSKSRAPHDEYHHEFHDFEAGEALVELREAEDYPGLVRYCKRRADRFPDDPYSQFYLGEAYVLNGEYEKAVEFLSKHHRKQPDNIDFQHVILDALFALGKTEDDFDWTEKPVILRMSDDILNICYEYLKPKRKPRSIIELYTEIVMKGYLLFTAEDLFKGLVQDQRFIVDNLDEGPFFAEVRVARR
jgi:tetratricopeptide (TPR) repeat protein